MDDTVDPSVYCEVKIEPLEDFECVEMKQEYLVNVEIEIPPKVEEQSEEEHSDKLPHKKPNQDVQRITEHIATRTLKKIRQTGKKNINNINSKTERKVLESDVEILQENDNGSDKSDKVPQSVTNGVSNEDKNSSSENQSKHYSKITKRKNQSEKRFQCSTCDKSFNRNSSLIKHIRIHTGEKPFQCNVCQKSFSEKCNLEIHTRIHTGVRPYQCTVCEKSFNQKVDLKRHTLIHTGVKPFQCYLCEKCFNTKYNLDAHKRTHTGEKPHKCNVCKKCFNNNINYVTHVRIHMQ